jgi:hypothetical protein
MCLMIYKASRINAALQVIQHMGASNTITVAL